MKRKDGRFAEEKKLATPQSRRKTAAQASQSRHFPENVRGKYRHCSARALAGLASFADRSTPLPRSANNGGALSLRSDGRKQSRPASDRAHPKKPAGCREASPDMNQQ
jgi:hypothetical protein